MYGWKKTISRAILFCSRGDQDWTSDYRIFSQSPWSLCCLFRPILKKSLTLLKQEAYVSVAYDDTKIKKKGKKVPGTSWFRDSMGAHFRVNLMWGIRYLQTSLLLPLYKNGDIPPRAIPIQFEQLPHVKRPRKKDPIELWERYKEDKKKVSLSKIFIKQLRYLRNEVDQLGYKDKFLLATVDNSFCNKDVFNHGIHGVHIVARTRKDSCLYYKDNDKNKNKRSFYGKEMFTPEQVLFDEKIKWKKIKIFHGQNWREVSYKEIKEVYWKRKTKRMPIKLFVLKSVEYRLSKKLWPLILHYCSQVY